MREHYDIRDVVFYPAYLVDCFTFVEMIGLILSASILHFADIMTSMILPNRLTTLDIGIYLANAISAEDDCCDVMFRRKRNDHRIHFHEFEKMQSVVYRSMI